MNDTFEFTLNSPLTEEQWDMITDVDMERTDSVTFHTKHGKEVEFAKVRHGKWLCSDDMYETAVCSVCNCDTEEPYEYVKKSWNFCQNCGAKMDAKRKE